MKPLRAVSLAILLPVLTSCDAITDAQCLVPTAPAIRVAVVDSLTGTGAVLRGGSTVVVRDGAFADSVVIPTDTTSVTPQPVGLANGRADVYQVSVRHPGYADWSLENLRVLHGSLDSRGRSRVRDPARPVLRAESRRAGAADV